MLASGKARTHRPTFQSGRQLATWALIGYGKRAGMEHRPAVSFVYTTVRVAIGRSRPLRLYITYNPVPDLQSLTRSVYFKGNGGPTR